jgi:hypothetical protein
MVLAAAAMGGVVVACRVALEGALGVSGLTQHLVTGLASVLAGVSSYAFAAWLLRIPEARTIMLSLRRRG